MLVLAFGFEFGVEQEIQAIEWFVETLEWLAQPFVEESKEC